MPAQLIALLVVHEVEGAQRVRVAVDRLLAQRGADELEHRIPLVQRPDARIRRNHVVGNRGLRRALHHAARIVLRDRGVDVLEVDVVHGLVHEPLVAERAGLLGELVDCR